MSDKAHFHLNGFVNNKNCRILWLRKFKNDTGATNVSPTVTVWCRFWVGGVIGPYLFEDEQEKSIWIHGLSCRALLVDFLWPQFESMDLRDLYFQQDGTTCHTSVETIGLFIA